MSELLGALEGLDDAFNSAPVQENSGDEFPDGNYVWWVQKADLVAVKNGANAGKPQVEWWLRVLEGPQGTVNRICFHYHRLYAPDQEKLQAAMSRLKTDMNRIGQEVPNIRALPAILQLLVQVKTTIKGTLKTGASGIQNCYFNGLAK